MWGTEQQAAIDTPKSSLANAETLAYFDRNAEKTKLITDASPVGLGADVVADRNANTGTPQVSTRPSRLRKLPGNLKDYELR